MILRINSKHISKLGALLAASFFLPLKAHAVCPVCTIAVGGALVLLERYGVDNIISGLWFGGLAVSVSFWTCNWLKKKDWLSGFTPSLVFIFYYTSIVVPLYMNHMIGLQNKKFWGIDKIVLGMAIGSLFFYLGDLLYRKIKSRNNGKAWFPFQRVVMPILPLILLTIVFYFITR